MKTLYFDCFSGVSGDMVIGALLDAGADFNRLEKELKKLDIEEEYKLQQGKVVKNGITSTKFDVVLNNQNHPDNHQHSHVEEGDHKHLHSHEHSHTHTHTHSDEDGHHQHIHQHEHTHHIHDAEHSHHHHHDGHHDHAHRSYQDIVTMIKQAGLTEQVEAMALKIFRKIGEAEGHIHGLPLETVHFHEVGAVDSIVDIVGTAILMNDLEIKIVKSSPVAVGSGKIHIDHGVYPVPAPATLEILKGVPVQHSDLKAELATPTGAAIVAVLTEEFGTIPSMEIKSIGYGAGTKTFPNHPNVLRVIIGEE
ncbi:LarC family nickel insertion protein [Aquibacillus saliphilus]|uniref:LarC family nickel insertion protein n=1 Tax=Aquibacillus saliphilus TaxID=1909422 RepID=UPI001CF0B7A1|nr:LarC family nickel insertion protein [Aquibacillus saliphilus]